MENVQMTEELLDLILMVQAYKKFLIEKMQFEQTTLGSSQIDWYKDTQTFFNSLDNQVLEKYGLKKNILSFEKVIHFKVTEEMMTAEASALGKFFFEDSGGYLVVQYCIDGPLGVTECADEEDVRSTIESIMAELEVIRVDELDEDTLVIYRSGHSIPFTQFFEK